MKTFAIKEFKPTIFFLARFVGLYLIGNVIYGLYVTHYHPKPDPATHWVTVQTSLLLTAAGRPTTIVDGFQSPITQICLGDRPVLDVYEGCNGINIMIIFAAFIFAFGPVSKTILWFIPLGLSLIHLTNLLRIALLFLVAEYWPQYMYFIHKYVFTGVLYLVIFVLWIWWVNKSIRKI
jgi:exosortase family protein XrtF